MRSRSVELQIITEALQKMGPHAPATRIWGRAPGASVEEGASGNVWAGDPHDVALHIVTRLYGRPRTEPEASPLAQAEDAKRRRDLGGELGALMQAGNALTSAPWYPVRPGDLVHVHYEATPTMAAFGETYIVGDASEEGDAAPGLLSMVLLAHTLPASTPEDDVKGMTGCFEAEAADDPLYDLWFEAGPHRLTIVRDGQAVHDGGRPRPETSTAAVGMKLGAMTMAAAIREAERYLERGEPELALARLRSDKPLPPCGAPGFTSDQADCARPKGHAGACSDDAGYTEPPHECPALPEQLHAVVTVGAKVKDVHFAGLYEDREAALDQGTGYLSFREEHIERYVKPAPGLPGEMILTLPEENELAATGVQLAVVVPLQILPDPRTEDAWCAGDYDSDYADDYSDYDGGDE